MTGQRLPAILGFLKGDYLDQTENRRETEVMDGECRFCAGYSGDRVRFGRLLLLRENRQAHAHILQALDGLGRTHLLGFEALTLDLDRLKDRVAELERVLKHAE